MATRRVCNMCGKDITKNDHTNFNISHSYGYDSKYDNETLDLDLCDMCLDKLTQHLIENCIINPLIEF